MAKYYSYDKVVDAVLTPVRLEKFSKIAQARTGEFLNVITTPEDSCYTHNDYWDGMTIVLGRNFYKSAWSQSNRIEITDIRDKFKHIGQNYIGVFYHELGHALYTDMHFLFEELRYLNINYATFAKSVVNILEDITIEGSMKRKYPYTIQFFDVLNAMHSTPDKIQNVSEAITNDPLNPGTLLGYLLMLVRGCDMSSVPTYELYENNKEFIKWGAVKCINTINARLRHRRQLAYATQLIKILDMKAPDKNEIENPSDEYQRNSGPSLPMNELGKAITSLVSKMSRLGNERTTNVPKQDSEKEIVDGDLIEQKAQREDYSGMTEEDFSHDESNSTDLTAENITVIANDEPVSRYSHRADRLDNHCGTSKYLKEYEYYVDKNMKEISAVINQIRKLKAHNNSGVNHYRTSGRFDLSTCYKPGNYKIFKNRTAPSPEADLVVEILVDNSGSMGGRKSKLAGEALIIFAEALNRLHIPFAVDAFTEGMSCITIKLKEFKDDYNKVKTNMTLFTEQFNCDKLCTFSGNIDEVNLRYVRDILLQQHHKDKMCIVISDGATCGDWRTLKKVADNMESQGILMLGVGIFDNNVEQIYNNHIVLQSTPDLEKLAGFLNQYLVKHIFK